MEDKNTEKEEIVLRNKSNYNIIGRSFLIIAVIIILAITLTFSVSAFGNYPRIINMTGEEAGNIFVINTFISEFLGVGGNAHIGGNVGIGTTTPTQKLDVNGLIRTGRYTNVSIPSCDVDALGSFAFDTSDSNF